jgi:hypothetical protein
MVLRYPKVLISLLVSLSIEDYKTSPLITYKSRFAACPYHRFSAKVNEFFLASSYQEAKLFEAHSMVF